ncbi:unnamed protein product [Didymodactylos carnosus]|uniref:Uncharacterized protein n=1 Tax=Didymodactylos carnosus TaxID=1234261 RepID=A0A8S2F8I1_9BILA|nr:unnamed protein product [Didymodactylos carnosus]CAF4180670.1 unnamed protein product [Didymodactylos carnosus]
MMYCARLNMVWLLRNNMALRIEMFHESYRILLYAPYWILNRTSFDFDFQIENQQTDISNVETPFLICSEKFDINSNKKVKQQDKWGPVNPGEVVPFWPHSMEKDLMRVRYTERNHILSQPFIMNQKHRILLRMENKSQVLPPLNHVYYTWVDPMKPIALISSVQGNTTSLDLIPQCSFISEHHEISYTSFIDGVQTVLLFADTINIIEQASGVRDMKILTESMGQRIQIGIHDIDISIVNDIKHEELLYISKVQVIFIDDSTGNSINQRGHTIKVRRQALDGLWIDYAWSITRAALHVRINRVQVTNILNMY